ncbi:chemotaxis protein CheW [Anaerophilus nitritogenes]|uniref:chemotaxis protein CheW n=1 Tax=Anaerophilus nitritogenes TaxID=2498136 RepID=UPI00101C27F0|nr:chemotaxis protein CheW [Anaerophilus nitritogenes]
MEKEIFYENEFKEDTQKDKYLIFEVENEDYAILIEYVIEIISIQPITEVPDLPEYIKGIINLRGRIIPIMDVRTRFKKTFKRYTDRTCLIVIYVADSVVGLAVDQVSDVIDIPELDIVDPPQMNTTRNRFMKGIGKVGDKIKLLIDCERLLNDEEIETIMNMKQNK